MKQLASQAARAWLEIHRRSSVIGDPRTGLHTGKQRCVKVTVTPHSAPPKRKVCSFRESQDCAKKSFKKSTDRCRQSTSEFHETVKYYLALKNNQDMRNNGCRAMTLAAHSWKAGPERNKTHSLSTEQ